MANVSLIIGNGFDLDLGLKTSYKDFAASKEWGDLVNGYKSFLMDETSQKKSLLWQINNASSASQWFDIEEEIHKFVKDHPDLTEEDIRHVKSEFEGIKKALCEYIKRCASEYKVEDQKISKWLLFTLKDFNSHCNVDIFSFNYTNPDDLFKSHIKIGANHIHGSIEDNDIVLGCDIQEDEKVNRDLSFMYKYNMLKKANHMMRYMISADEVIIFGHSINEMDFCYFREYLKEASSSSQQARRLTIFTYDEQSEREIKDNMRNQGISVSDLYNNLEEFTFIHTQKLYAGDEMERYNFSSLASRIQSGR